MKKILNRNTVGMRKNRSAPFRKFSIAGIFTLVIAMSLLGQCSRDVEIANSKKQENCARILALYTLQNSSTGMVVPQLSSEDQAVLSNSNIKFSYSCSAESTGSPSCKDYFYMDWENRRNHDLCESGYTKRPATCSRQNHIGTCTVVRPERDGYTNRVYSFPSDSEEAAIRECTILGGRFTPKEGRTTLPNLVLACGLQ